MTNSSLGFSARSLMRRFSSALQKSYQRLAGPEASLSSVPLAVLRTFCGPEMTIQLDGKPFTVSLDDILLSFKLLAFRSYEESETAVVRKLVRGGDFAVDAGAHIGYFTAVLGDLVGPRGRVLAIEPDPNNASLLRRNIDIRGLSVNAMVVQAAIGDRISTATLYKSQRNRGDHRMFGAGRGQRGRAKVETVEVAMTTLDTLVRDWPRVDFIKMDIQGYEPYAIRGMRHTLAANESVVVLTEYWPWGIRNAGDDPLAVMRELRSMGFQLWQIPEYGGALRKLSPESDAAAIARIEPHQGFANLLCARHGDAIDSIGAIS